jgi:hypothetical protein
VAGQSLVSGSYDVIVSDIIALAARLFNVQANFTVRAKHHVKEQFILLSYFTLIQSKTYVVIQAL